MNKIIKQISVISIFLVVIFTSACSAQHVEVKATNIYCPNGCTLIFKNCASETYTEHGKVIDVQLAVDNQPVSRTQNNPMGEIFYTPRESGQKSYRIQGIFSNSEKCVLKKGCIESYGNTECPLSFNSVKIEKIRKLIITPQNKSKAHDLILQLYNSSDRSYKGTYNLKFNKNNYELDLSTFDDGEYLFYAEMVDDDCHYISPAYEIKKSQPLEINCEKSYINAENGKEELVVDINLSGVPKTAVLIFADGKQIGVKEINEGKNSIKFDATQVEPKKYNITATTNIEAIDYKSQPLDIEVVNASLQAKIYRKKVYDGKVEKTRQMKEIIDLRRRVLSQSADLLSSRIGKPKGTIGLIRGLVTVHSGGFVSYGETSYCKMTIEKNKNKKSGFTIYYANDSLDNDAKQSLYNAVKFAQYYIQQFNPSFSADDYNYQVILGDGSSAGGDSAGAAIATLVISNLLKIPIRNDIAITGTVDRSGNVGEVGAYNKKSFAAFTDPNVTTLIIPRTSDAVYETLNLPWDLVASHRIITANKMTEVLRHALVTQNTSTYIGEKSWKGALAAYISGSNILSIAYLKQLYSLMPEDLTSSLWYNFLAEEQPLIGSIEFNEGWMKTFLNDNPDVINDNASKIGLFVIK